MKLHKYYLTIYTVTVKKGDLGWEPVCSLYLML